MKGEGRAVARLRALLLLLARARKDRRPELQEKWQTVRLGCGVNTIASR